MNARVWIAQGFGIGRIPWAPGTFGSVLGILWFACLLALRRFEWVLIGAFAAAGLSVWLSAVAEKALGKTDPSSVVIDEICAMPFCFMGWLILGSGAHSGGYRPSLLAENGHWKTAVAIFMLFRVFDIAKPWPVNRSQRLPGGWGITVDDLLAAGWVNVVMMVYYTFVILR